MKHRRPEGTGILIETIAPSQYRHIEGMKHVHTAYEALVAHHQPTTKINRIQVAMEFAKFTCDPRQETLPDFIYRFQVLVRCLKKAECRKKSRESGRHGVKTRVTKEDHSNAAVYLFSMFENGHDLDMVNPDNESKEDEVVQPAVVDVGNTEPIKLGEPGEALPLRTEPDWSPTRQDVRQLSIGRIPYKLTFLSRQDLAALQIQRIQDPTQALTLPP
ncbi:hypothetical protein H310_12828 [Aphanomyces invadans]|uniref:Uncharacterized protein n=1 Tax=Aphanomyces invadans TaxID=157072 RepID=A0A024TFR2_9STRA|nr:hypothetical protein H310_12828 [Aphanomyces invadans]ETV92990.1 hypothetical protein H310_12828 [Aphanomyces invadans]|eukprot:XP_008878255.1 hypothetical protein H310_12828 [Aphanomyces invadans]